MTPLAWYQEVDWPNQNRYRGKEQHLSALPPPISNVTADIKALPCADRSGHHGHLAVGARGEIGGECGSRAERAENGGENDFFHGAPNDSGNVLLSVNTGAPAGNRVLRTKEIQALSSLRRIRTASVARSTQRVRAMIDPCCDPLVMAAATSASSEANSNHQVVPALSRDPCRVISLKSVADTCSNNGRRWLWVPAFAGTTC